MNQVSEGLWSPSRWIGVVSAVFLLQIALIWVLGSRRIDLVSNKPFETSILLQPNFYAQPSAVEAQEPAFLALPNVCGFSGDAWLKYEPSAHQLTEWTEPPHWLALPAHVENLGDAVSEFARNSSPPLLRVADQPVPWNAAAELPLSPIPLPEISRLEFDGLLLDASVQLPALPSWQSNEAVSNSIVRVAFERVGQPFSCVLLSKSGLKEADDYALRLANSLRYRAAGLDERNGDTLRFGKLIFYWHTVPAPLVPRGVTSIPVP